MAKPKTTPPPPRPRLEVAVTVPPAPTVTVTPIRAADPAAPDVDHGRNLPGGLTAASRPWWRRCSDGVRTPRPLVAHAFVPPETQAAHPAQIPRVNVAGPLSPRPSVDVAQVQHIGDSPKHHGQQPTAHHAPTARAALFATDEERQSRLLPQPLTRRRTAPPR